eukprot:4895171-Prymnesium_polylepis.1
MHESTVAGSRARGLSDAAQRQPAQRSRSRRQRPAAAASDSDELARSELRVGTPCGARGAGVTRDAQRVARLHV